MFGDPVDFFLGEGEVALVVGLAEVFEEDSFLGWILGVHPGEVEVEDGTHEYFYTLGEHLVFSFGKGDPEFLPLVMQSLI